MLIFRQFPRWLFLLTLTTGLMVGCGPFTRNHSNDRNRENSPSQSSSSSCRKINHDLGQTQICGEPRKVAALNAQTLDLLLSLGVQPSGYAVPLSF